MSVESSKITLSKVVKETSDTLTCFFTPPDSQAFKYRPGQFITLILTINGKEERRPYSLSTSPHVDTEMGFTVKRVPGGLVSNFILDNFQAGYQLDIIPPDGRFSPVLHANFKRQVVLIGAGSGITPLFSIAKSVLKIEEKSHVSLIYSSKNQKETIFFQQLEQLKQTYLGRFSVVYIFTQPETDYMGPQGRMDEEMLEDLLYQTRPVQVLDNVEYYLCGPEGFMAIAEKVLNKHSVEENKIKKEFFFQAKQELSMSSPKQDFTVYFLMNGKRFEVVVPSGKTLLEAGEDAGLDLPFSCRNGVCTSCMGVVVKGSVKMSDNQQALTDSEIAQGYVLNCCSVPTSEGLEIDME